MSGYTHKETYKTEFEGDNVTVYFKRFNRRQFFAVTSLFPEGKAPATMAENHALVEALAETTTNEDVEIVGLKTKTGESVTWEELMDAPYFITLFAEIVSVILSASVPKKAKQSPSPERPTPTTTA